ncbi:hypothetical protein [Proteus mirabilis]|uniref:hypothetical protein n=1 Tax=Proteus mirabilis TaxID=584 RepID=UPI002362F457|nr:hypothetical protein [Proteus mirabilis]MDC9748676.1 hypothetical protein [Proteus mirabilis]
MKLLWILVAVCSVIGFVNGMLPAIILAESAPQQAAGATIGIGWAVIPYCFVKAVSMMWPTSVIIESNKAEK